MEIKSINNVLYSCKYQVVWTSKYCRKVLTDGVEKRLEELIRKICAEINADIFGIEIQPSYVHLFLEINPQYGINRAVRHIKASTSHILRSEFPSLKTRIPTLWTTSYYVSTVGSKTTTDDIEKYVQSQKNL